MKIRSFVFAPEGDAPAGSGDAPAPAASPSPAPSPSLLTGGVAHAAPVAPAAAPQPGATPPAFRDQLMGPDGGFAPNFVDFLPDDVKAHAATLGRLPNVVELARSYVNARSKLGERPAPPAEGSTPEQVKAWRELTGVPETPDGYAIQPPKQLPEGVTWDAALAKDFVALAHEINIPPAGVQKILEWHTARQGETVKTAQAQEEAWYQEHIAKQEQELRASWGDQTEANFGQALKAARTFGLPSEKPSEWTPKDMVMALHRAATMISEDKFISASPGGAGKSSKQAALEIMDLTNTDRTARAYRGEFGIEEQKVAQDYLQKLLQNAEKEATPSI